MQKSNPKTNNSVKAGLEIAAHTKPLKKNNIKKGKLPVSIPFEKDEDELIHQAGIKPPKKSGEEDMDDLVHQKRRAVKINSAEEQDIDDLLHSKNDYKPDQ